MDSLYYTGIETPVGWIAFACTGRGLFALEFYGPEPLSEDRVGEWAALEGKGKYLPCGDSGAHPLLGEVRDALNRYFENRMPLSLSTPLDLSRGTSFRQKVWDALRCIPFGETRSYQDVARMIGQPPAARAVGQACAENPVPLFVPCHRVLARDGSLRGFSSGIPIKKALLDLERPVGRGRI